MLETIVQQVQLRAKAGFRQDASAVAIFSDNHWHLQLARNQQRLVAELLRQPCGVDLENASALSPIAAREHVEFHPTRLQQFSQQQYEGSLPRAARRQIPDADHGPRQCMRRQQPALVERVACCHDAAVDAGKWLQGLCAARAEAGAGSAAGVSNACSASTVRAVAPICDWMVSCARRPKTRRSSSFSSSCISVSGNSARPTMRTASRL